MTEHTALPLELIAHSGGTYIIDADGEIFNDDAFTVTACNNYEKMLLALKGARGVLYSASCYLGTSFRDNAKYWHGEVDAAILEAQEQIRKVEE